MKYAVAALIATVAAECAPELLTSITLYDDDKCETETAGQTDETKKALAEATNVGFKKLLECGEVQPGAYGKLECTDAGVEASYFTDDKCTKKVDTKDLPKGVPTKIGWGECTDVGGSGVYWKGTGAQAMAATAIAGATILATLY